MKYCMVFDKTGDEIPFDPINQELLDFYLVHLNQQNLNKFWSSDPLLGNKILSKIHSLKKCLLEINSWLPDLIDMHFEIRDDEFYLNQHVLNKMHADWVQSQSWVYDIQKKRVESDFSGLAEKIHDMFPNEIQTPPLADILDKLGLTEDYNSLNDPHIHGLELMFNTVEFAVRPGWTKIASNPFDKTLLTNNCANLSISFNHLGRTLYNKFLNFDVDLEHNDENSFDELLGGLTLSFVPSQTIPLSAEYVNWCSQHNRVPIGKFLNIGNIPNLSEDLTRYRIIVFRNLLRNNSFSIHKS
jgi:hypothetical protein